MVADRCVAHSDPSTEVPDTSALVPCTFALANCWFRYTLPQNMRPGIVALSGPRAGAEVPVPPNGLSVGRAWKN